MAKKKPTVKQCKCVEGVNEQLADKNAQLTQLVTFGGNVLALSGPLVLLEKMDKKKRSSLPSLFCAYCPFCGKKYPE